MPGTGGAASGAACVAGALALAAACSVLLGEPSAAALAAVPVAGALRLGRLIADARGGPFAQEVADSPDPAALCRLGGDVLVANAAMRHAAARPGDGIAALLGGVVECDAALVYRLSRRARELGFAFEQVRDRAGARLAFVVVRRAGGNELLWRVYPPERLAGAVPTALSDHYEAAPFAYLCLHEDGSAKTNLRFRELFGQDASALLARLSPPGDGAPGTGRTMLPGADGTPRPMFVCNATPDAWPCAELLICPVCEDGPRLDGLPGLDHLPVALLCTSADGRILWLNAAAARMLGARAGTGTVLPDLLETRGRPIASLIDEALSGASPGASEMVQLVGGDREGFLQIGFARAGGDGGETLLAVLSDASELRQLEDKFAQSQKMEAVGKLAGGVAHDFNNLLTAINGHCDLLLLGKDAKQPDYSDLMQIRQNANRAAALVRQLLAFSRKQTLNPEVVSINEALSDTLYLLDRLIGDRVTLSLDAAASVGHARVDQRQLEQAIMNLVVNARDAMPAGGRVTISTRRRLFPVDEERQGTLLPSGDYVELAVADEGTGIDEQVIGKVFDPFFTTKPQGEGTGLGLSTVYGIVKQSGGFVFAENRPEGGACFRMLLPSVEPPPPPAPDAPARAAAPDLTGRGSVLIVEDEAAVRSFAARALRLRGYDVAASESAAEALAWLAEPGRQVDLVVSDVMMPGMDGPTFVARARGLRPDLKVLFVSGYAEDALSRHLSSPGFAFLPKPFSLSDLTAKVKEVLAQG